MFDDVPMRVLNALTTDIEDNIEKLQSAHSESNSIESFDTLVEYQYALSEHFKANDRITAMMLINEILEKMFFDEFQKKPQIIEDYLGEYLECLDDLTTGLCDVNGDNKKYETVKVELVTPRLESLKGLINKQYDTYIASELCKRIDTF